MQTLVLALSYFKWLQVFKISTLKTFQVEAVNAAMSKKDCCVIQPTGGGKSLCFMLPAVVQTGLTLVIAPTVALINDQVSRARANKIRVGDLSGNATPEEQRETLEVVSSSCLRM